MTHTRRSTLARYGVAALASGAAELVRLALSPAIMPSPFLASYGAVLLSTWYGGLGPGLLAVGCAVVAVAHLFLPLSYPLTAGDWLIGARIGLFALTSVLLVWITTLRVAARERIEEELRQAQRELEARVGERTAALSRANAILSEEIGERERAQKALRESEERFANAFHHAPIGMVLATLTGRPFQVNRAFCDMLGYSEQELLTKSTYHITHPDDFEMGNAVFARLLSGAVNTFAFEKRYIHKLGHVVWALASVSLLRDRDGTPLYLISQVQDITERKRTEESLQRSQAMFESFMQNGPAGAFLKDEAGRYVYVNPVCERISRRPAGEWLGRTDAELWGAEEAAAIREHDATVLATDAPLEVVESVRHADGTHYWLTLKFPVRDLTGRRLLGGMGLDITERRQAEEQVRHSEERFRKIFEEGPLGMALVGADYRLIRVNATLCRMLGYGGQELTGLTFPAITHPDDIDADIHLAQQLFAGTLPSYQIEKRYLTKRGDVMFASLTASIIRGDDGSPLYGLGMVEDITARKQAEEAARQHRDELAHVSRVSMLGEMAAGLGHEINQPLGAIVNYARGCVRRLEGGGPPGELRRTLQEIADEALRAAEILRRIRRLARKEQPRREAIDLNQLVADAVRLVDAESREHGVTLRFELVSGLPPVRVDGVQIQQVVLNLVRNGIEAMHPGDGSGHELLIRTSMPAPAAVEVAVCDTGAGLPCELGERVFDAFVSTKPNGLGMGLSISRSIIEAHGGRLWAVANPECGATFRFTLPVSESETSHAE